MVGIHLTVIIATFLDPKVENLSESLSDWWNKQGCSEIQGFGAEEVGRGWGARGFSTLTFLYHLYQTTFTTLTFTTFTGKGGKGKAFTFTFTTGVVKVAFTFTKAW